MITDARPHAHTDSRKKNAFVTIPTAAEASESNETKNEQTYYMPLLQH